MFKKLLLVVLTIGLLSQNWAFSSAQSAGVSLWVDQVDLTAFPLVALQLNAWDENGLPLASLTAADFTLQEGAGAVFHPAEVTLRGDADLQVLLAIDVSKSMQGTPLEDAKIAAARFLDRLAKTDRAGLIAFANGIEPDVAVLAPGREVALSSDLTPLYDLIENLNANGATELYSAAAKAVALLKDAPAGHRAVLLLSDGKNDPPELGDPEAAIRLAQVEKVPFFVIGLGNQVDEPYLRRLAQETGGLYRAAPTSAELARLFGDMATLLKTRYVLSYASQLPADGRTSPLTVRLNRQGQAAEAQAVLGPLPNLPTATALPTATPAPTFTAVPPSPTPQVVTATPLPPVVPAAVSFPIGWVLGGGGGLILVIALLLRKRKAAPPVPEACARCGFDLTGKPGPCPACGETRRLPKHGAKTS